RLSRITQELGDSVGPLNSRCLMHAAAQIRKSLRFGDRRTEHADRLVDRFFDHLDTQARELVLYRASLGRIALQIRQAVDDARDNSGEQRLFAGKMPIDRW